MKQADGLIQPDTDRETPNGPKALSALPLPSKGSIQVCTLGGVADIGMNWTLYGHEGSYILVDAGTSFAPRETVGVKGIFPDPTILKSLKGRLLALVVTHFHEDHVGAIHHVWPRFADCPIYAPPYAAKMLANRFAEAGTARKVKVKTFFPGNDVGIGPFQIRTVPVAHSTPDCVSLAIRAGDSTVLHTGDWKVDDTPTIGHRTDFRKFARLGEAGIDLMLCDSTNADREVPSTTEASVERAFTKLFAKTKGMVVVCSFGSNVGRMASAAKAAAKTGRRVALAGRSLRNAADAAEECKLLKGVPRFLDDPLQFKRLDRRKQVLVCTGTQGEENAALAKIAAGVDRRMPRLQPGDLVVHSARVIPGNEDYVYDILQKLREQGAEVMTADVDVEGDPVHVTGHPCRADLRRMYAAVKPKISMPVHGTPAHLEAHAALARDLGVAATPIPQNGSVYELLGGRLECVGRLASRYVAVMEDEARTMVGWDERAERAVLEDAESFAAEHPAVAGDQRGRGRGPGRGRQPRKEVRRTKGGESHRGEKRPERLRAKKARGGTGRNGGADRAKASSAQVPPKALEVVDRRTNRPARMGEAPSRPAGASGAPLALDATFIASFSSNDASRGAERPRGEHRHRRGSGAPRRPTAETRA